jgi:Mn-dependent DtxR family transcriptional regulator
MSTINWLRNHYNNGKNLRYLREVIRREDEGSILTASEMASSLAPITAKAVRNAMRVLKDHGLVDYKSDAKPQIYSSTTLGHYVLTMFGTQNEAEDIGSE